MRFIPISVHGVLDFVMGAILIAAPWLLGFASDSTAARVPITIGLLVIGYSLMTDYEFGAIHAIPMHGHLLLDLFTGAVLALSPWIFNFNDRITWPHLTFGLLEVGAALMTQTKPSRTSMASLGHRSIQAARMRGRSIHVPRSARRDCRAFLRNHDGAVFLARSSLLSAIGTAVYGFYVMKRES